MTAKQPPPDTKKGALLVRRISDVKAKPVKWLWPGRFALGKFSMIAGNPGLGKSQITSSIAAILTTGGKFPLEQSPVKKGSVLFLSAEDDAEDTIRPRLEAAGADLDRVYVLEAVHDGYIKDGDDTREMKRSFNLKADLNSLANHIRGNPDIRLVVIDPISSYMGAIDSHNTGDVRSALSPLIDIASEHEVAIVAVSHLNKSVSQDAISRISGSLAFVAASRAAFVVVRDNDDENKRLFLPIKNNIGKDNGGLSFSVESFMLDNGIETSRIAWNSEAVTKTASEVMNQQGGDNEDRGALGNAIDFIKEAFYSEDIIYANDLKNQAISLGVSVRTLQRALKAVGADKRKETKPGGKWYWFIPAISEQKANFANSAKYANLSKGGSNGEHTPRTPNFATPTEHGEVGEHGELNSQHYDFIDISNFAKNDGAGELRQTTDKAGWGSVTCHKCLWWNNTSKRCANHMKPAGGDTPDPDKLQTCSGYKVGH